MGFWNSLKKFGSFALPIAGAMTGNPLLAAAGGGAGGYLGGGGFKGAAIGAGTGFLGSKLFGGGGGNPLKGGANKFMTTGNSLGSSIPNKLMGGVRQGSSGGGFFGNLFGGGGGGFNKNPLMTGGALMLGSQLLGSPQVPELPQSVRDYQNMARTGNPLQNQAVGALSQQLGQSMEQLSAEEEAAIIRQLDLSKQDELKNIQDLYTSARPGTDYINDSSYQRDTARLNDRYATLRADSISGARRNIRNDFATHRGQQISNAMGLSRDQLQQLADLSEIDYERLMNQYDLDYNERQALRDYIFQIGGDFFRQGLGMNQPGGGQYGV